MWRHPVTQENITALGKHGITVLPVGEGELACRASGPGRMLEPEEIAGLVLGALVPVQGPLTGKRIVISSGPTEEPLDPVRVITNRSSGRMGAALASAALLQGAEVVVVSGPALSPLPAGARIVPVRTALEMRDALVREFAQADVCIMAAAVSDFRAAVPRKKKIKRSIDGGITLALTANPDITALLGGRKGKKMLVGFALETSHDEASAKRKMKEKQCDLMVLNRVDQSLGRDDTRISIMSSEGGVEKFPVMAKTEAAGLIIQRIAGLLG
ncbi:MAG: bifunctional phosphopantothenoylcysteine decarboxylase/phosphopantothenate--cysteine ligase CoaBC, partial [Chitinispirillaceae bacterium]|nr:bifunctional phosphopantothenoylcysteine decarboxylase/phosphopantothenate--cysteine ligase CoaBC [Chitinispirillaceae bacterium]